MINNSINFFSLLLTCLLLDALFFPYSGISHDAALYFLQVENNLLDKHFENDIFFKYGSQDNYTLFTFLLTPISSLLGTEFTFFALYILCKVLYYSGSIFLFETLFKSRKVTILSTLLLATYPIHFDGGSVFALNESFFSARSVSYALVFFAIALASKGRFAASTSLYLVCGLFHPFTAFWGSFFSIFEFLIIKKRLKLFFLLIPISLIFIFLDSQMPEAQISFMRDSRKYFFASDWGEKHLLRVACSILISILGITYLRDNSRKYALIILSLIFVSLTLSLIPQFFPSKLLITSQAYRLMFFCFIFSIPILFKLLLTLENKKTISKKLITIIVLLCIIEISLFFFGIFISKIQISPLAFYTKIFSFFKSPALLILGIVFLNYISKKGSISKVLLSLLMLVFQTIFFYVPNNSSYAQIFDTKYEDKKFIAKNVNCNANTSTKTVYWPGELHEIWFKLHCNSYYSRGQLGGSVYSKDLSAEATRRLNIVNKIEADWFFNDKINPDLLSIKIPREIERHFKDENFQILVEDVLNVCLDEELDYFIFRKEFRDLNPISNGSISIYNCKEIKEKSI